MASAQTAARLARLERQALDRLRQDLAAVERAILDIDRSSCETDDQLAAVIADRGQGLPLDIAHSMGTGLRERMAMLAAQRLERNRERLEIDDMLMEKLLDAKRWETIEARARRQDAARLSRLESAALDEAATMAFRRR